MKTYTLPYPISANRYWKHFKGRSIVSKEASAYRSQIAAIVGRAPIDNHVYLSIELLPKLTKSGEASKVCLDLDNCLKVALDALQGCLYVNDNQVRKIKLQYGEPVKDGGLLISYEVME